MNVWGSLLVLACVYTRTNRLLQLLAHFHLL